MPAQAGIQYAVSVRWKLSGRLKRLCLLDRPLARAMTPAWDTTPGQSLLLQSDRLRDGGDLGALRFDHGGEVRRRARAHRLGGRRQLLSERGIGRDRAHVRRDALAQRVRHVAPAEKTLEAVGRELAVSDLPRGPRPRPGPRA